MRGTKPAAPPSEGVSSEPGNEPLAPKSQSVTRAVTTAGCTATHCCRRNQTGGQSKESILNRIIPSNRFVVTHDSYACVPLSPSFPRLTCAAHASTTPASSVTAGKPLPARQLLPTPSPATPPPPPPCHHSDPRPFLRDAPSRNMSLMMLQAHMPIK